MIDGAMVALGISPEGRPVPIQLTAAGLLAVSGGSGGAGNGAFVGGYTLIGIAPDGTRVPIAVDSNGVIQTSGSSGDATAQGANTVQAGPTTGAAALPTYRALVGADLPSVITKATSFTANGAASLPALSLTGIPFAGTGTTSFPLLYLNNSGATASTTLSTSGTALGINSHGTPDLMNLMVDGVSKFGVVFTGAVTYGSSSGNNILQSNSDTATFRHNLGANLSIAGSNGIISLTTLGGGYVNIPNPGYLNIANGGVYLADELGLHAAGAGVATADILLRRLAAASLQLGAAASATPVAYTLTVGESAIGGTTNNGIGGGATFRTGLGTGNGATGPMLLQTAVLKASGTTAQTYATALTLDNIQNVAFGAVGVLKSYVVSGLPPVITGGLVFVTDAVATAITGLGLAVVGGGTNKVVCYSDGTNWLIL